jgi:hypothetical protein
MRKRSSDNGEIIGIMSKLYNIKKIEREGSSQGSAMLLS